MLGLGSPPKLRLDKYANYQPAEDVKVNETLALDTARRLVIEYYQCRRWISVCTLSTRQRLNSSRPFLIGTEGEWRYLSIVLPVKRQC